jgi:predicted phosphodiesterase
MRIAALTDIHAMASTLEQALYDARVEGFDVMLIMGDLLSYGVAPLQTLDLVHEAISRDDAILISGNHDIMYRKTDASGAYVANLPDWIGETVAWTKTQIPDGVMDDFEWQDDWSSGPLFVAHANPYEFGDWRYINARQDAEIASVALSDRGFSYGAFGHCHRARTYDCTAATVFTIGSLGQPRDDRNHVMQWAMIDVNDNCATISSRTVAFDRDDHLAAIRATTMSEPTRNRLCSFFA